MDLIVARTIHVLSVVVWIGGVAFVTLVLMPTLRRTRPKDERLAAFLLLEGRFAPQAQIMVALAGLTGLYLIVRLDAWARFASPHFWWMYAMICLWVVFAVMLFLIEPFFLHKKLANAAQLRSAGRIFDQIELFHQIILVLSLVTVAAASAGSHGL